MSAFFWGWSTEMIDRLERDDRDVIGLSCSGDHSVNELERLMIALRKRRKDARIILSGQIVERRRRARPSAAA
jgi:hypothetical protein